jgi:alcohol dehydrogenase
MKAARFHGEGPELRIEEVPEPVLQPGCAVVEVEAAFVVSSLRRTLADPSALMLPPLPFTPGMDTVGRVVAAAEDVSGLRIGEPVYCDHWYGSHNVSAVPDHCFLGYFGMGEGAMRHLARWPDGGYAKRMVLPAECMTPLGPAAGRASAAQLCRLGWFGTAYGAFVKAGLRPGDVAIVNGATGMVGTSGVLVALAMGAARVVAVGRNRAILDRVAALSPTRIAPVALEGSARDAEAIAAAARGARVMLDAVGRGADPGPTMAGIAALAQGGVAVLVGAGIAGPLSFDYTDLMYREVAVRGSLWFPRRAAAELVAMIGAGTLDLSAIAPKTAPLDRVNDALREAAQGSTGLSHWAVCP